MKFLVARRKTMHVFHSSGQGFALDLLEPDTGQTPFREVSSLRLPRSGDADYDIRASFQPLPQITRPALGNR